jgi:hypothetical protein
MAHLAAEQRNLTIHFDDVELGRCVGVTFFAALAHATIVAAGFCVGDFATADVNEVHFPSHAAGRPAPSIGGKSGHGHGLATFGRNDCCGSGW